MTYKNILVHVDATAGGELRIAAATALGARFGCPLTGAFVASSRLPDYMFADVVSLMPQDVLDGYLKECVERIEVASNTGRATFSRIAGLAPKTRWVDVNGDSKDDLVACARRHDLVILPPLIEPAFSSVRFTAAEIGMASGGPVLVLKHGGYPVDFGKKILIAWKESREAVRALRDAWPFLETAAEVHFLKIGQGGGAEVDSLMRQLLKDHGCVTPRMHVDENDVSPVEDLIRLHVGRAGADLVVLGLYGHSRLQELMLGGVSRNLLADPPMPLLVSH